MHVDDGLGRYCSVSRHSVYNKLVAGPNQSSAVLSELAPTAGSVFALTLLARVSLASALLADS